MTAPVARPRSRLRSLQSRFVLLTATVGLASLGLSLAIAWRSVVRAIDERHNATLASEANRYAPRLFLSLGHRPMPYPRNELTTALATLHEQSLPTLLVDWTGRLIAQTEGFPSDISAVDIRVLEQPLPEEKRPRGRFGRQPRSPDDDEGDGPPAPPPSINGPEQRVGSVRTVLFPEYDPRYRIALVPVSGATIAFVRPLAQQRAEERSAILALLLPAPFALLTLALGAAWAARSASRPIRALTALAEEISSESLGRRLTVGTADAETARLAAAFNEMLERLERGMGQARRFTADAAHELNTPLAILHGHLDQALQLAQPGSEEQQRLALLLEEIRRLRQIVDTLLVLARADAGLLKLHAGPVRLDRLLGEVMEDVEAAYPNLNYTIDTEAGPIEIQGDAVLLRQAVSNLVINAAKYNRDGGRISARVSDCEAGPGGVRIEISNTGTAIPEAAVPRLFERFQRSEASRNRERGGLGLGLALAREFARLHGGTLTLERNADDDICFVLELPASAGE